MPKFMNPSGVKYVTSLALRSALRKQTTRIFHQRRARHFKHFLYGNPGQLSLSNKYKPISDAILLFLKIRIYV